MNLLTLERRGPVAVLTLNNPKQLNALASGVLQAVIDRCAEVDLEPGLHALVLTGAGRAFAAGADIEEMGRMNPVQAEAFSRLGHRATAALEQLGIPTIAAVNGYALGGGCELALACDWIYAAEGARFGQPEVTLGLIPGFGGTSRLVRRVGIGWAKQLVLTGEAIGADEALRIGLVNRVFPKDELLAAAVRTAEAIASNGPLAVAHAKRVIQEGQSADVGVAHALEQAAFGLVFASEDRGEGIAAFAEKRDPKFTGS